MSAIVILAIAVIHAPGSIVTSALARSVAMPADLAAAPARHPGFAVHGHERLVGADLFSAMRGTLGADRAREHLEAHGRQETVTHHALRAEQVVDWATRGGSRALGLDGIVGSLEEGKKADIVLIKNDDSPVMFPLLNPYGHVAFQAGRGDVHTVIVNGRLVKHAHRLVGIDLARARHAVEETVEYAMSRLGEEAWAAGMNPDIPETKVLDNPYTYTDYESGSTRGRQP